MDKLKAELRHALGVPEQLFGDSFLRLTHEPSGTVLEFTALEALRCACLTGRRPLSCARASRSSPAVLYWGAALGANQRAALNGHCAGTLCLSLQSANSAAEALKLHMRARALLLG